MTSVTTVRTQEHNARRRAVRPSVAMAVATGLLAAACGSGSEGTTATGAEAGSAAETFDKFNAMSGQQRHDALVKAAEKEGTVVIYTASSGMDPVIAAFEKKYDINVKLYASQSDNVMQRLTQEYEAGTHNVDVLEDAESYTAAAQGMTHKYVNPKLTPDVPGYDPESQVAPTRLSVYTQAWNTNMISEDEIPDTLDGFTDPKWKGRLSLDPRDWIWYTGVRDYYMQEKGWTEQEVDEMMATLASYSTYTEGHTTNAEFLLAGEFPATLSVYTQSVDRELQRAADAPITWRKSDGSFIKPLVYQPQGAALMKNAPHPAAAMLFVDFMLGQGQKILSREDRTPTAIPQPGGPLEGIPSKHLYRADPKKFIEEREEWTQHYDEILRQN